MFAGRFRGGGATGGADCSVSLSRCLSYCLLALRVECSRILFLQSGAFPGVVCSLRGGELLERVLPARRRGGRRARKRGFPDVLRDARSDQRGLAFEELP